MHEALVVVLAGAVIGIPASLAATRYASRVISDLLFGVKASDVPTIGLSTAVLLVVALFAGFLPAHRATRVDPTVALRYE